MQDVDGTETPFKHDTPPASEAGSTGTGRRPVESATTEQLTTGIDRGVAFLRSRQLPTGAWLAPEYFEPQTSAAHLLTLAFVDRVPLVEARGYARFLSTLQRDDGSFPAYPHAEQGDVAATALVLAALETADLEEHEMARARARAYIERNGGFEAVVERMVTSGDVTAVYVAMSGLVDPFALPDPDLSFMLATPVLDAMLKRMNAGVVATIIFIGAVTRLLRERKRPVAAHVRKVHEIEAQRCLEFLEGWLNPNGNYCGTTTQTDMIIAALYALGCSPESPRLYTAIHWFDKHRIWDERGLHLQAFTNENWMTAWALRALLRAGVPRDDRAVGDALDYLCWSQSRLPMPEIDLRRKNAHRTGAWGFQEDNFILVDMDDTGIILSALGLALGRRQGRAASNGAEPRVGPPPSVALEPARAQRVQDAVDLALQNLLDMQCDDGGWAGFVWNLGSKKKGPLYDKAIPMPATLGDRLRFFLNPPLELAEPAVEGLTGRVLQGLGANGFGPRSPEVQRAVEFLRERQLPDGSWWERWIIGYLTSTASIVSGLADCGWDLGEPWLKRAIRYLLSKQNADGGWGETPAAYERPDEDISCPSMPPLTAIVLCALVDAGLGDHPAASRAARYLLETQDLDGRWPTNGWLQIYLPYTSYYLFEGEAWYRPVEALAKLRAARAHAQVGPRKETDAPERSHALEAPAVALIEPRTAARRWSAAELRAARSIGDPLADDVARELLQSRAPEGSPDLMAALTSGKALQPDQLPDGLRGFLAASRSLPDWTDLALVRRGQELFTEHGWMMAAGLFCSSLPQAYCAANGARVLTQTHRMTRNARARILDTAQFLFDVCGEGSFEEASGRGVEAAQRVRLIHALIRQLIVAKGDWDEAQLGIPINQEDLAGTLMTFSVVLLDALETAGLDVSPADQEAFLHLWKVAGHVLGVAPALLPVDVADARALMQVIRDDQWAASVQGRLLATELMAAMREYLPTRLLADVPAILIRFFAPAEVPKILGIESVHSFDRLIDAGLRLGTVLGRAASQEGRRKMVRRLSRDLMVGLINVQRRERRPSFAVPGSLARGLKLAASTPRSTDR